MKKSIILCGMMVATLNGEFKLRSPDFKDRGFIDKKFTCQGANRAPKLFWSGLSQCCVKSYALIVDDPDAPTADPFVHWVLYGIPASRSSLEFQLGRTLTMTNGMKQGINNFNKIGWDGPCPPKGKAHRYIFTLYALDSELNLEPGVDKESLLAAMKGHIIKMTKLVGLYKLHE